MKKSFVVRLCWAIVLLSSNSLSADDWFISPLFASTNSESDQVYRSDALRIDGSTSTLLYDVYRPMQIDGGPVVPETLPGLILIHGGGFRNGSKNNENMIQTAHYFARRGYVVSTINYRLLNDSNPLLDPAVEPGPFSAFPPTDPAIYAIWASNPANEETRVASAANAAHNDASQFANFALLGNAWPDVDIDRIVIMGTSAGAITSLMAGYSDHPNGPIQDLGAVVSLAGALYGIESVIDADDPPLWFQHGINDPVVDFSNALAILQQADDVGLLYSLHTHDQGHSTTGAYFTELTTEGLTFAEDSLRFLHEQLNLGELAGIRLGDVNLDCEVNLLDVGPFIELLESGDFQPEADVNQDGVVNLLDVSVFVNLLAN